MISMVRTDQLLSHIRGHVAGAAICHRDAGDNAALARLSTEIRGINPANKANAAISADFDIPSTYEQALHGSRFSQDARCFGIHHEAIP